MMQLEYKKIFHLKKIYNLKLIKKQNLKFHQLIFLIIQNKKERTKSSSSLNYDEKISRKNSFGFWCRRVKNLKKVNHGPVVNFK